MLTINEILDLIQSNKINETNLTTKDLMKIEFYKQKLNEDVLHLPPEIDDTIDLIVNLVVILYEKGDVVTNKVLFELSNRFSDIINNDIFIKHPILSKHKFTLELYRNEVSEHEIPPPPVPIINESISGQAIPSKHKVAVNFNDSEILNKNELIGVLRHEFAHYWDYEKQAHRDNISTSQTQQKRDKNVEIIMKDKKPSIMISEFSDDSLYFYRDTEMQSYAHSILNDLLTILFSTIPKEQIIPSTKKNLTSFISYIEKSIPMLNSLLSIFGTEVVWITKHFNNKSKSKIKFRMMNNETKKQQFKYIDGRKVWKKVIKYIFSLMNEFYKKYNDEKFNDYFKKYHKKNITQYISVPNQSNEDIPDPPE